MKLKRKHLARDIIVGDLISSSHPAAINISSVYNVVLKVERCSYDLSMLIVLLADGRILDLDVWNSDFRTELFECWTLRN